MKSSNRQPRYRRRFLIQTRALRPHLQAMADQHQFPELEPERAFWGILRRGLCLKSAQEVGATPEGSRNASNRARKVIETRCEEASETICPQISQLLRS